MKIFLLLTILHLTNSTFAQTTITLHPDMDATTAFHVGFNSENTNYGTSPRIETIDYVTPNGDENGSHGLFHFDLSSVPANMTITNASLDLFAYGPLSTLPGHFGDNESWLQKLAGAWEEDVVTWNTEPGTDTTHQVLLPQSTSPTQDYLNIDLTEMVQDWYSNQATNYGLILKLVTQDTVRSLIFYSTDFSDSTKWPVLHVTYDFHESAQNISSSENFSIHPNPVTDFVLCNIYSTRNFDSALELYDVTGKLIQNVPMTQKMQAIDLSNLSPGVYVLKAYNGGNTYLERIVKQ
jgi:hypothetical protein